MRKLIFQVMVSLDGFVEGPNSELDWHNVDEEFNDYAICLLHKVDTIIFGRKTYEMMAAYWPSQLAADDDPVVAGHMNSLKKIVFSNTIKEASWQNSEVSNSGLVESITQLKQAHGKDIAILGSCNLAQGLLKEKLIDEYRIITNPILLGRGKTLFHGFDGRLPLKLTKTWIFNSGNVLNYYANS
jgi:dihydrofolate reductase